VSIDRRESDADNWIPESGLPNSRDWLRFTNCRYRDRMTVSHEIPAARKLLLVDDDRTFAQIAARALARRGFEVAVAYDVNSALNLAASDTNYAVVDLVLGDTSGLRLLEPLKVKNPSMRILLLSGYASIETIVDAMRRGVTQFLAKPVDADQIVAALTNVEPSGLHVSTHVR
jgi:two-component system response regulator RegA